ncbi:MAG: adenylate/guanylate cyclase domain-containing protein [Candidatus Neomarinimicrobiota bacterium]|nr:adenylate/guanylate cyclase domain-containing protein [Candidatus Neomarinimicrobiota bacterium]
MTDRIIKFIKSKGIGVGLTLISILVVGFMNYIGVFDSMEFKMYDYRFHKVRGPLTGLKAADSTWIEKGTDIVLVEVDDEAWRLIQDGWPYPRGTVWSRAVENLSNAGAKVIVFDIQFDAPETKSEFLMDFSEGMDPEDKQKYIPLHGDIVLGETCQRVLEVNGTKVIMSSKLATETTRVPPQYIAEPVEYINRFTENGVVNDMMDEDGFSRQYNIMWYINNDISKAYLSLAMEAVKAYLDIGDEVLPEVKYENGEMYWQYGKLRIDPYGNSTSFLVNYYGPPSYFKAPYSAFPWATYDKYSLSQILDTDDYLIGTAKTDSLGNIVLDDNGNEISLEDNNWMSNNIPREIGIPEEYLWILDYPEDEHQFYFDLFGIVLEKQEIDKSNPFYNKIVMLGVNIEVLHDTKSTPFYNYSGLQQLTPGMETHANAIQTLLHNNYIKAFGGKITGISDDSEPVPIFLNHLSMIALLSFIAFFLITYVKPVIGGILIVFEGLVYFIISCGYFSGNMKWLWETTSLPELGESVMLPIVAPLIGIGVTYSSNIIYQFINEQKDKRFLKSTFGTYISPELIDQMFEDNQEPKLGGDEGYHTAFFTDIQSFSAFSEILSASDLVELLVEYLTDMTNILLEERGTLDKYIGDAIVAFYGAPVPVDDHEYRACLTAVRMQDSLDKLRHKWRSEGDRWPEIVHNMQNRIGITSGQMVTGNMGSAMRMNYTMMGDTVNLAARLESSAKQYGVYIQVAEETYKVCKEKFIWRNLDYVVVMGKTEPAQVFELIAEAENMPNGYDEILNAFHEALGLYKKQEWKKAIDAFKTSDKLEDMFPGRKTNPSRIYIPRCEFYMENPPGDDWDGSWTLTSK